jgi:hypothetical protein
MARPGVPAPPPRKRSRIGWVIGIVVGAVVLMCVAGGIYGLVASGLFEDREPAQLRVGEAVRVTEGGAEWTVAVTAVEWLAESCSAAFPGDGPVLVLSIRLEVLDGRATLYPYTEFTYVDDQGRGASQSLTSSCASPRLTDTRNVGAGTVRTGEVAFDVPSGRAGEFSYAPLLDDTAARWTIPGPDPSILAPS